MGVAGGIASRPAAANRPLVRLVAAHVLAVVAEYAAVVAVLVHAFTEGGARATGIVSLALLGATLAGAPVAAVLTNRLRPALVRRAGLAAQVAGYGVAAVASGHGPRPVVVVAAVLALGAVSTLRPTGAVLLPAVVRSSGELTLANLWISRCECVSALVGPLAVAGLLWAGGPPVALAGCAVAAAAALALSPREAGGGPPPAAATRPLASAIASVRAGRGTTGLFGVVLARYVIVGALDVLLVVLAFDALDLGQGGVGLLNALVGAGALASTLVAAAIVRRARLAPWLAVGLTGAALLCAALGGATSRPVAILVLPLLGLVAALFDALGRMLLQRSADPGALGALFALVELVAGVGLLVGSGTAQVLIAVGDVHLALYGLAGLLALILVAAARSVWSADGGADVPVVEMSLLRRLPMFAPLPPVALEALARSAVDVPFAPGEVIVRQGEPGDRFYAVADGQLDVVMSGEHIRVAGRGSFFGEVALLADVPRTATVTGRGVGELLAVDRVAFLVAVTGSDTSHAAAWGVVRSLQLDAELPAAGPGSAPPSAGDTGKKLPG